MKFSYIADFAKAAEASNYDANVYIFITGPNIRNGLMGMAPHRGAMGSVCRQSRGERLVVVKYVKDIGEDICDPGTGPQCHNGEVCTGQVNILNSLKCSNFC